MPSPSQKVDDLTIGGDEILWRRVASSQIEIIPDTQQAEPSSGVFRDDEGLSVSLASETTLDKFLNVTPHHSVVGFTVKDAREFGCVIFRAPTPEDPAHLLIWRDATTPKLSKTIARNLRNKTHWVRLIW